MNEWTVSSKTGQRPIRDTIPLKRGAAGEGTRNKRLAVHERCFVGAAQSKHKKDCHETLHCGAVHKASLWGSGLSELSEFTNLSAVFVFSMCIS